jgi:hypothetical protein
MWPLFNWNPAQSWLVWERMNFALPIFRKLIDNDFLLLKNLVLLACGSIDITEWFSRFLYQ